MSSYRLQGDLGRVVRRMARRPLRPSELASSLRPVVRALRPVTAALLNTAFVGRAAKSLSHKVAGAPDGSLLRCLSPIRSALKGEAAAPRVVQIMQALEEADVHCWLAGGWGIDALLGHQTRRHDDVDIVLANFAADALAACDALARLGFRRTDQNYNPTWMPDQWTLEDDAACRIDLLSIDWDLLMEASGLRSQAVTRDELAAWSVTEGLVDDHPVLCLSAAVQRVFHSAFESRQVDHHDLANLERHDRMHVPGVLGSTPGRVTRD